MPSGANFTTKKNNNVTVPPINSYILAHAIPVKNDPIFAFICFACKSNIVGLFEYRFSAINLQPISLVKNVLINLIASPVFQSFSILPLREEKKTASVRFFFC